MYKITNMTGDVTVRFKRRAAPGRATRTRIYRLLGRAIKPKKHMTISAKAFDALRTKLEADEAMGLIKITAPPRTNGVAKVEVVETPAPEEKVEVAPVEEPTEEVEASGEGAPVPPIEEPGDKPEPLKAEDAEDLTAAALEGDEDDPDDLSADAMPTEAVEGLEDAIESPVTDDQVEAVSVIPSDSELEALAWRDLQKLAKTQGVKAKKKDAILDALSDMREAG
jgi:hypothetical protein